MKIVLVKKGQQFVKTQIAKGTEQFDLVFKVSNSVDAESYCPSSEEEGNDEFEEVSSESSDEEVEERNE